MQQLYSGNGHPCKIVDTLFGSKCIYMCLCTIITLEKRYPSPDNTRTVHNFSIIWALIYYFVNLSVGLSIVLQVTMIEGAQMLPSFTHVKKKVKF